MTRYLAPMIALGLSAGPQAWASPIKTLYDFPILIGANGPLTAVGRGQLWGTASEGDYGNGSIFVFFEKDHGIGNAHGFYGPGDGAIPVPGLIVGADGNVYGATQAGGQYGLGTLYSIGVPYPVETVIYSFDGTAGASPASGPVFGADGNLYGTTPGGGASNDGVLYQVNPTTGVGTGVLTFSGANGQTPNMLTVAASGLLLGTTQFGGSANAGVVYQFDPSTSTQTILANLPGSGVQNPVSNVVQDTTGLMYLCVQTEVYSLNPSSGQLAPLFSIGGGATSRCHGGLTLDQNHTIYGTYDYKRDSGVFSYNITTQIATQLAHFTGTKDGKTPGPVTIAPNGHLVGNTYTGGADGYGTIFQIK
jgi:uncharacterized repeat protein (TIGR03803 family)